MCGAQGWMKQIEWSHQELAEAPEIGTTQHRAGSHTNKTSKVASLGNLVSYRVAPQSFRKGCWNNRFLKMY